ncbi:MAG TPA: Nif3-like dinuclear metal center hexameric protein [Candidatus Limiplasma sp.]|nr:Nif3-like dinuclear metal center hexameric protein [Candidatus Limiplasma sp.]HRX08583.1 Nif3-like dinuclear metal center hexameric protein [Candidatus Limiplasma sp.]
MTVNDVYKWLDAFAPFETQESYDNAGLLVGDPAAQVRKILFALDVTKAVVQEAARFGAELIVAHHPLMFHPVQTLLFDHSEGAVLKALAVSGISLIAAHTNLDQCPGGIADSLAEALELTDIQSSADSPYLRTGTLLAPMQAKAFLPLVSGKLQAPARLYGDPDAYLHSITVIPGAGGEDAAYVKADAVVIGEIKHHELLAALDKGLVVVDAGHYPTEFPGIAALYQRFQKNAAQSGWAVEATLFSQPPAICTA